MRVPKLFITLTLAAGLLLAIHAFPAAAVPATRYVAPNADCGGATLCYATLQAAIDAAQPGDEIRVAGGVYTDVVAREYNLTGFTHTITQVMYIDKSLTVRGGYTVTDWTTARPDLYPTVIDPQERGRGGYISIPDWTTPITVTLEGLSITHGVAEGSGGGLYALGGTVTLSGCHVTHNQGSSISSGLYLSSDVVMMTHNVVAQNLGPAYGVAVDMGQATLSGNRIVDNGNGLLLWNTVAKLTNNVIAANGGNGLSVVGGSARARHTTVADNGTAGVDVTNSGQGAGYLAMTNTIIAGHDLGVQVGGNDFDPSTVDLVATLWDNLTDTQAVDAGGQVTTVGDVMGDPAFVAGGDYHLTAGSPARNRGWSTEVRWDIDSEPRDPLPDLGADEYFDPGSIRQVYLPLAIR